MVRPSYNCVCGPSTSLQQIGYGVCTVAGYLDVSPDTVSKIFSNWRKTGFIKYMFQGHGNGYGMILIHAGWLLNLVRELFGFTLQEYVNCLFADRGVKIDQCYVIQFLLAKCISSTDEANCVVKQLHLNVQREQMYLKVNVVLVYLPGVEKFVFVHKTSVCRNVVKHYGGFPKEEYCINCEPNTIGQSQTLIAILRSKGVVAECLTDYFTEHTAIDSWLKLHYCSVLQFDNNADIFHPVKNHFSRVNPICESSILIPIVSLIRRWSRLYCCLRLNILLIATHSMYLT